ncbi:MAG: hypothetical protein CVT67_11170 [Actinobacteria bacterium HGW-Actinobacteria-7]|nr:MAG: hypothetical protein CVT67_11170 [Actinobacteria bacterium HGW-Actinobacteria-7]
MNVTATRPAWILSAAIVCVLLGVGVGLGRGAEALAAVAGLIVLVAASRTQWISIGVFMAVTSLFGNVSVVGLGGLPDVTVTRLLTLWLVFLSVTRWGSEGATRDEGKKALIARLLVVICALYALGFLAAMKNTSFTTGLQLYLDQIVVPFALLFVAARADVDQQTVKRVLLVTIALGVVWSGIGIYEFVAGRSLFAPGGVLLWARESYSRVGGSFINPAALGTAIGISTVVVMGSRLVGGMRSYLRVAVVALCVIGLAVTLTRASWLAAAIGVLVVGLFMGMRGVVAWAGAGIAASGVGYVMLQFLGESALIQRLTGEGPVFNRIIVYVASLKLIADHFVLGVGLGMFAPAILPYMGPVGEVGASYGIGVFAAHNSILYAAAEIGVPGTLLLVLAWIVVTQRLLAGRRVSGRRTASVVGPAVVVIYVINAMFIDMWLTQNLNPLVYLLVGVMCAVSTDVALGDSPHDSSVPRAIVKGE